MPDDVTFSEEDRAEITAMVRGAVEVEQAKLQILYLSRLVRAVVIIALMEVLRFVGAVAYWWFYTPWPQV